MTRKHYPRGLDASRGSHTRAYHHSPTLHSPNDTYIADVHTQHWQLVSVQRKEKLKQKKGDSVRHAG